MASNDQVAHLWANQSKDAARTGNGNFSFRGPILYSYSTPIANLIRPDFVLFSRNTYSITTAGKHMSPARRALGYRDVIKVEIVCPASVRDHETNMTAFHREIANAAEKAKRARLAESKVHSLELVERLITSANRYAAEFGLSVPVITGAEDAIAAAQAFRAEAEQRKSEERARKVAEESERRAAWIAGASVTAPRHGGIVLRVKPSDSTILETSWGAEVPLTHATHIVRLAKTTRASNRMFAPSDRLRIGHFFLDRIEADGTIVAGCHVIAWQEAERLALQLGVFETV